MGGLIYMDKRNIGYVISESPTTTTDVKIVTQKNNRVIAEGTMQDTDEQNRNTRWYSSKDLFPQLTCARTTELVKTGNMKGEEGHPSSKDIARQQTIDPDMVCVKYLKFWTDGNLVKAQFKGTNNNRGEWFNNDLLDGELPSFSLRALGTIETVGGKSWVRNLKLITYDRVIYPSHKRAYTERIVSESGLIACENNNKFVVEENYQGMITPITNDSVINYIKTESANIYNIINNFDTLYESIQLINNGRDVQLMGKAGELFIVNLESYIQSEIRDYCNKR
jgi:hypothetical protein